MQLAFQQSGAELHPISEEVQQITMDRARARGWRERPQTVRQA